MIIITAILVMLIYFQEILKPFILALVFWYFIKETRIFLGKIKLKGKSMPRWIRGTIALIFMLVVIGSIGELLVSNIEQIVRKIPEYSRVEESLINEIGQKLNLGELASTLESRLEDINITQYLTNILNSVTVAVGNVVMIVIYVIFLLIEEIIFASKIKIISSTKQQYANVRSILKRINDSIRRYILMKTIVSISTGIMSYIVLVIFGVDFAILWAFIIFLFNYIPYVGSLVATLLPSIFAIFQFNDVLYFIWVFLAVEAVQIVNANYLEPRIMGRTLNLSPLVVVLSLVVWGSIWGVLGMILSVPIMSVLTIIMAQFPNSKKIAILLSETGNVESLLIPDRNKESE